MPTLYAIELKVADRPSAPNAVIVVVAGTVILPVVLCTGNLSPAALHSVSSPAILYFQRCTRGRRGEMEDSRLGANTLPASSNLVFVLLGNINPITL